MKRTFILVALVVFALLVMALPAFATVNSATWSFTMNNCYVNGADSGAFKYMNPGNLKNSGSIYISSMLVGSNPYNVTIDVHRSATGFDPLVGRAVVDPGNTVGVRKYFTTLCGAQPHDEYYLVIWRPNFDGTVIKGSGSLSLY